MPKTTVGRGTCISDGVVVKDFLQHAISPSLKSHAFVFASANRPSILINHDDFGILNIEALERFRLDHFASRYSRHRYVVAYEKDTSESTEIRIAEAGH